MMNSKDQEKLYDIEYILCDKYHIETGYLLDDTDARTQELIEIGATDIVIIAR